MTNGPAPETSDSVWLKGHIDPTVVIFKAVDRMAWALGEKGHEREAIQRAMAVYVLAAPRLPEKDQQAVAEELQKALQKNDFLSALDLALVVMEKLNLADLYFKTVPWVKQDNSVWEDRDPTKPAEGEEGEADTGDTSKE